MTVRQLKNHRLRLTIHLIRSASAPRNSRRPSSPHPSARHEYVPIISTGRTNPSSPLVSEVAAMISQSPTTHHPTGRSSLRKKTARAHGIRAAVSFIPLVSHVEATTSQYEPSGLS